MRQEAAEPWASAMLAAGLEHNGRPSYRALAVRADLGVETVRKMLTGQAAPEPQTVRRVADALKIDVRKVSRWVAQARTVREPWVPPPEADLLTAKERRALDQLIRAMTDKAGEHRGNTAPMTQADYDLAADKQDRAFGRPEPEAP